MTAWDWGDQIESGKVLTHVASLSSVSQLCLTFCDTMDCSMPGLPAHHQLLEFTQTHVPQLGDAIQPCHPLSSPSPPTVILFQHEGRFH